MKENEHYVLDLSNIYERLEREYFEILKWMAEVIRELDSDHIKSDEEKMNKIKNLKVHKETCENLLNNIWKKINSDKGNKKDSIDNETVELVSNFYKVKNKIDALKHYLKEITNKQREEYTEIFRNRLNNKGLPINYRRAMMGRIKIHELQGELDEIEDNSEISEEEKKDRIKSIKGRINRLTNKEFEPTRKLHDTAFIRHMDKELGNIGIEPGE